MSSPGERRPPTLLDHILGGLDSPANFLRRLRFIAIIAVIVVIVALITGKL